MDKTLEENGIPDESSVFEHHGIEADYYYPALHIHYQLEDIYKDMPEEENY
jgi:hypothetical protein